MHLWPSLRLRDSFKNSYLNKLEWNLHRMNSAKKQNRSDSNQQNLLENDKDVSENKTCGGIIQLGREVLMIASCCYCCFCCGACTDSEESTSNSFW